MGSFTSASTRRSRVPKKRPASVSGLRRSGSGSFAPRARICSTSIAVRDGLPGSAARRAETHGANIAGSTMAWKAIIRAPCVDSRAGKA